MVVPLDTKFFQKETVEGHVFTAGDTDIGLRKNQSLKLFFKNPSDSGRYVLTGALEISSSGSVNITHTVNVTEDTQGTELNVRNLRPTSQAIAKCEVYNGGTYSGGITYPESVASEGLSEAEQLNLFLAPGENVLVEAKVRNPGGADIGKKVTWTPIPESVTTSVTNIDTGEKL